MEQEHNQMEIMIYFIAAVILLCIISLYAYIKWEHKETDREMEEHKNSFDEQDIYHKN